MTVQPLRRDRNRVAGESALQHVEHAVPLLAQGVEASADDAEMFSAGDGAEAARDFLFHLRHAHGPLARVRKRDGEVTDEEQYGVGMLPEALQQIECNGLLRASTLAGRMARFGIAFGIWSSAPP